MAIEVPSMALDSGREAGMTAYLFRAEVARQSDYQSRLTGRETAP